MTGRIALTSSFPPRTGSSGRSAPGSGGAVGSGGFDQVLQDLSGHRSSTVDFLDQGASGASSAKQFNADGFFGRLESVVARRADVINMRAVPPAVAHREDPGTPRLDVSGPDATIARLEVGQPGWHLPGARPEPNRPIAPRATSVTPETSVSILAHGEAAAARTSPPTAGDEQPLRSLRSISALARAREMFRLLVDDTIGSASNGGLSLSGTASSTGSGVELGGIQRDFTQGELRQTQRDLDLAINGTGFLVLTRGDDVFYTRTGSFEVNKNGFIVLAGTDYRLATLDGSGRAVSLSIDASRTNPPAKTTTIKFADNLSSTATSFGLSDIKVYDAVGTAHKWQVQFSKPATAAPGEWAVKVTDDKGTVIGTQTLKFNAGVVDPTTAKLVFDDAANGLSVTLDFSQNVTSFSSGEVSTLRTASVDGQGIGTVTSATINADGELELDRTAQRRAHPSR